MLFNKKREIKQEETKVAWWLTNKFYLLVTTILCLLIYEVSELKKSAKSKKVAIYDSKNCLLKEVLDGDTIEVDCQGSHHRIRVLSIDAPGMLQKHWGKKAKNELISILKPEIRVDFRGLGHYQRDLAYIFVDDIDAGLTLVERGLAVVYTQYNPPKHYAEAMKMAKKQKLGIWSEKGLQQNPRQFRVLFEQ